MSAYKLSFAAVIAALVSTSGIRAAEPKTVTWMGWFSCSQCAAARAASGTFTATNPDCAKRCIDQGSATVFISKTAQGVFSIKDYPKAADDLGYLVEVTGLVREDAKTLSIQKVTRLSEAGPACALPRRAVVKNRD